MFQTQPSYSSTGVRTGLGGPDVCRCVERDDVDVIFEVLQQLVKLLLAAAAVCIDLHLVSGSPRRSRLDVLQVHSLLLQEGGGHRGWVGGGAGPSRGEMQGEEKM